MFKNFLSFSSSSDKFFLEKARGASAGSTPVVDLAILALAHLAIFILRVVLQLKTAVKLL